MHTMEDLKENLGALVEVHEHSSNGFDRIANVGGNTGFDKSDSRA